MVITGRQQRRGAIWGAAAFLAGVGLAWWVLGPGASPDRFNRAMWLYLSGHYATVGPISVAGLVEVLPRLGLVSAGQYSTVWHALPVLVVGLAAAGMNISMGYTLSPDYILRNSAAVLVGYLPSALIAIIWSGASGPVGTYLLVIAAGFFALAIGSRAIGGALGGLPVFAVTSIGGLVLAGLLVLVGGLFVLELLLPVAIFAAGGGALGSALVFVARAY